MYFRKPGPEETGEFFPTSLIQSHITGNYKMQLSTVKVGNAMKRLGFKSVRYNHGRGWLVVPISGDQMQRERILLAHKADAVTDGEDEGVTDYESDNQ